MQVLIRTATPDDVDRLCAIRTSVVQNHLSLEQMAGLGITPQVLSDTLRAAPCGWSVVGPVDGDDVRYEKRRAP